MVRHPLAKLYETCCGGRDRPTGLHATGPLVIHDRLWFECQQPIHGVAAHMVTDTHDTYETPFVRGELIKSSW